MIHYIIALFLFIGTPSLHAYLLDIIPPKEGGMYFGIYNMLTGVALFIGALAGGYLTELNEFLLNSANISYLFNANITALTLTNLTSHTLIGQVVLQDTLRLAVIISFAVVAIGRFVTSFPFLTLKEVKQFPSSWGEVAKQVKKRFERGPPI